MKVIYNRKQKRNGLHPLVAIIILLSAATIYSFVTNVPEKEYTIKATLTKIVKADKWINIAKQALLKSDLPSRDVSMILDSLSEFQNIVVVQVNSQLEADKKLEKPPLSKQDSSSKKTN